MINPEYKITPQGQLIGEPNEGLKHESKLKFVQVGNGVALYESSAYLGKFISENQKKKVTLDENKNIMIPSTSIASSESIDSTEDENGNYSLDINKQYLKRFVDNTIGVRAKPNEGVIVERVDLEEGFYYELSLDDNYNVNEHCWDSN